MPTIHVPKPLPRSMFKDDASFAQYHRFRNWFIGGLWLLLGLMVLGMLTSGAWHLIGVAADQLTLRSRLHLSSVLVGIAAVVTAVRYLDRVLYGLLEIAFGLASIWRVLGSQQGDDPFTNAFALLALVYLLGRGFSNIVDGLKDEASRTTTRYTVGAVWVRWGREFLKVKEEVERAEAAKIEARYLSSKEQQAQENTESESSGR